MGLIRLVELVWFGQNGALRVHTYNLRIQIHTLRCLEEGKKYLTIEMYGTFRIRGLTLMLGHRSFSLRAMPVMVPPVPAPATNMSTLPGGV